MTLLPETNVPRTTLELRVKVYAPMHRDHAAWEAIAQTWADRETDPETRETLLAMAGHHRRMANSHAEYVAEAAAELARRDELDNAMADAAAEQHEGAKLQQAHSNIAGC